MHKLCCALLVLVLVSCCSERGTKSENPDGKKSIEIEENEFSTMDTLKGLEMFLIPDTFESGGFGRTIKCVLWNNTEHELGFSSKFSVEKWNGSRWVLLPFVRNFVFTEPLYSLSPQGGINEVDHDLLNLADGAKEKGKYRLTVEVSKGHRLEEDFRVFAEFTVK